MKYTVEALIMCPAALNDIVTSRIERTHVCVRPPSIETL
jgi:hypothetical protein